MRPSLAELVVYFLKLGATGFGGPVALANYMRADLFERRKWFTDDEYGQGLAIATALPGPMAYKLAIYCGYIAHGVIGGVAGVALAYGRGRLRTLLARGVVGRRQVAEVFEIQALDEPRAMAPLRAHHHEGLVRRHPEEPGREAGVAAKRADASDHLHQRGLRQIAPVFVGERVTQELLLDARLEGGHQRTQRRGVAVRRVFESRAVNREGHGQTLSLLGSRAANANCASHL